MLLSNITWHIIGEIFEKRKKTQDEQAKMPSSKQQKSERYHQKYFTHHDDQSKIAKIN